MARTQKGRRFVSAIMSRPVSVQGPDAAVEELKTIFQYMGFVPQKVHLVIPRHLVTARFLKVPSVDDKEIDKIIKIESIKHLPYTEEKVIYGYRIAQKADDGYSRVLLVIAQASVVDNYTDILNKAGVKGMRFFSLSSEALFSWYMMAGEGGEKEDLMLVNLDMGHIDMDVIENGLLLFTRGVAYGAGDPRLQEKIAQQIEVSINTYQKESERPVGRVVLTGPSAAASACRLALSEKLKIPVDIIDQTRNIPLGEDAQINPESDSFAELMGLSMRPGDIKIDLLSEDAREEATLALIKANLITALLLFAILAALAFGLLVKKMCDKYVYMGAINTELKKMEPKAAAAKKMMKDMGVTKEIMSRKPLAVDVFCEVCAATPYDISLSTLDFESGKALTIRGTAPALGDVLKYVNILENSPYLGDVKVIYANKRMAEKREITDFEVDAILTMSK